MAASAPATSPTAWWRARSSGRLGLSLDDERAVEPRDVPHLRLRRRRSSGKKYLPKLASGECIGCFGLTEPDAGSDPGGMTTRARKTDGGYVISGAKTWISQRADRRRVRRLGQVRRAWRRDPRLRARQGHEGAVGAQDRGQAEPARVDHRRDRDGRGRGRRGRAAAERRGTEGAVRLPQPRPLRHQLGRDGRGRGSAWHGARQYGLDRKQFGRPLAQQAARTRRSSPTCRPRSRSGCRRRCASAG